MSTQRSKKKVSPIFTMAERSFIFHLENTVSLKVATGFISLLDGDKEIKLYNYSIPILINSLDKYYSTIETENLFAESVKLDKNIFIETSASEIIFSNVSSLIDIKLSFLGQNSLINFLSIVWPYTFAFTLTEVHFCHQLRFKENKIQFNLLLRDFNYFLEFTKIYQNPIETDLIHLYIFIQGNSQYILTWLKIQSMKENIAFEI